ncbi:hypothetical protein BYT27DRAFT_7340507 [Phlegmacium glaucopus]|nr:hypothetical protein BYT27DRAFT_7340507 [Phlegmacium glaucopus]
MPTKTSEFEHAYYIGNCMGAILYGLELTLYGTIVYRLFRKRNQSSAKSKRFCAIYSTAMITLSTINVSCNAVWGSEMWITHRDDPGGVPKFIETQVTVWYETLASTAVIACVFLSDALLLYRLFLIYSRSYPVLAFPALAYIVALGLAIVQVVISGLPNGNFFGGRAVKVAVSYYVITICLNIILTALICGRLIRVSKSVSSILGEQTGKVYTGAAVILVESAALYSASGIMYLVPYALELPIADLFGQLWTKMSVISPLLIILRVSKGRDWTSDAVSRIPVRFATSVGVSSTTLGDGDGRNSHVCLEEVESSKSTMDVA